MSGRKNVSKVHLVEDGDMSGNITSDAVDVRYLDNVAIQLVWTGTPTGTFDIQGTVDGETWAGLSFGGSPAAVGAAGNHLIALNNVPFDQLRVVYTSSAGTGTLQVHFEAKEV